MRTAYAFTDYPTSDTVEDYSTHRKRTRPPSAEPRQRQRPSPPLSAPISRRRSQSPELHLTVCTVGCCGLAFSLVMIYTLLHAATLAMAFRGRQLDNHISFEQSSLHADYSRIAVITSPDKAREVALARHLQKVLPEQIDDQSVSGPQHLAVRTDKATDTADSVAAAPKKYPEAKPIRIVLATP